jgi:acetyltransferase-like isoleucine patch superfamily enzyme
MKIASTAVIYPEVILGENVTIEDFCIIGCHPKDDINFGPTVIGSGSIIRSHTVIYAGNNIGLNFQTGNKTNIRENNIIGDNVSIGSLSNIEYCVKIKDGVRIHSQVFIPEFSVLEEKSWIGPNVVLTNAKYPRSEHAKNNLIGPFIKKGAIIGANTTILSGVIIEEGTLIGAGSVVTKNTKPLSIYFGNPAKFIKYINEIKEYESYTTL